MNFSRAQNISTLDPSRLVASDFIDLDKENQSRPWRVSVRYRHTSAIFYEYTRIGVRGRSHRFADPAFPPETRGFLYLHRPSGVHPCAATLRFRICDRDLPPQESFARGKDLLLPKGGPWEINMLRLFSALRPADFRECLLQDKVLSPEAIEQVDNTVKNYVENGGKGGREGRSCFFHLGSRLLLS
ncbi:hypothetical protein BDP27DRAFT_763589 [Rhodocollybia butyracea]|uniref:Uncharacterized protein n=1 Tax=Rhodocollybia butyracea TaxID=206335 RepID=A0A9P5PVQ6_9AGAR|nr:hypothetical protein BDP27DRAFT_763589 [Rhodocollybia butyracea]